MEVSELKQTSPHTSVLGKLPARAWGRDQQLVGVLIVPCFILLCYIEPEWKCQESEWFVYTTVVSTGEFWRISLSWGLCQEMGQLEKELEQKRTNQNSCAPEDVKSSYNHLWNQRLTSSINGKLLPPDGGGKHGTEAVWKKDHHWMSFSRRETCWNERDLYVRLKVSMVWEDYTRRKVCLIIALGIQEGKPHSCAIREAWVDKEKWRNAHPIIY